MSTNELRRSKLRGIGKIGAASRRSEVTAETATRTKPVMEQAPGNCTQEKLKITPEIGRLTTQVNRLKKNWSRT